MASYFQILGLSEDTPAKKITQHWKKLMLKYHPDKNPGDEVAATEHVKLINDAYENIMKRFEVPFIYESQPNPEYQDLNIPLERIEKLSFVSLSQLCEDYISKISAANERASELLRSYRKSKRRPPIYYASQIKSKISGFMTHSATWRTWLNNRQADAVGPGPKGWWRGVELLDGVHADLSAKLNVMTELNNWLMLIEDARHDLSEDQWKRQAGELKQIAAWLGTQLR